MLSLEFLPLARMRIEPKGRTGMESCLTSKLSPPGERVVRNYCRFSFSQCVMIAAK